MRFTFKIALFICLMIFNQYAFASETIVSRKEFPLKLDELKKEGWSGKVIVLEDIDGLYSIYPLKKGIIDGKLVRVNFKRNQSDVEINSEYDEYHEDKLISKVRAFRIMEEDFPMVDVSLLRQVLNYFYSKSDDINMMPVSFEGILHQANENIY